MERVAVFVDAGYFWIQVSHILFSERKKREDIILNAELMRESLLREVAKQFPTCSLLRIYWYDGVGANGVPSEQHRAICKLDDIKMRYGSINKEGQQKGVDGLLMSDLISLAQNKAITHALVLSGDADLVPGISAAQALGVRIHRLEMYSSKASSPVLCEEVDQNREWSRNEIESFAHGVDAKETIVVNNNTPEELPSIDRLVDNILEELDEYKKVIISKSEMYIPKDIDKEILYIAKSTMKRMLGNEEKKILRDKIREKISNEVATTNVAK